MQKLKFYLSIVLTIAVLQGFWLGLLRQQIEEKNDTVEIVVDYTDLETLAAREGYPLDKLLFELKEIGVTSIGLSEQTPSTATSSGEFYFSSGKGGIYLKNYYQRGLVEKNKSYFFIKDSVIRKRVIRNLLAVYDIKKIKFIGQNIIEVNERESQIRNLGIGFSEKTVEQLGSFKIIPRLSNNPKYSIPKKINIFSQYKTIIFEGEELPGYPDKIGVLANALKKNSIKYGYVEIIKQFGNSRLKKMMSQNLIRVHGIAKDELKKVEPLTASKRFIRSVKERSIRMLYIRPYLDQGVKENLNYIKSIVVGIKKSGFLIGEASYPSKLGLTHWQIVLLGLGVAVALVILVDSFIGLQTIYATGLMLLSLFAIYFHWSDLLMQKTLSLAAAILFPAVAVIHTLARAPCLPAGKAKKPKNAYWSAAMLTINIAVEALLGAVIIIGLLADTRFMLGAFQFSGVKLALVAPLLIVAGYFILNNKTLGKKGIKEKINYYLNSSIKTKYLVWGGAAAFILLIIVARSGNFILPVLRQEIFFRSLLEKIFLVRPRFKEFLIGYPVLFIASYLLVNKKEKRWTWLLIMVGTLAPITLINSFTHIHTPIMISLARSFNGLVLGVIVGFILLIGAEALSLRLRKKQ
ncbi:DUF5693 family protein [Candidatus Margulisiibacteriota bacterium]